MKKSVHPSMPTKKSGNKKKSKKTGSTIGVERSNSVELGDAVNGVAKDPIAGGSEEIFDDDNDEDADYENNGGTDDDNGNDKVTNELAQPKQYITSKNESKQTKSGSLGKKTKRKSTHNEKAAVGGKKKTKKSMPQEGVIAEAKIVDNPVITDPDAINITTLALQEVITNSLAHSKRTIGDFAHPSATMGGLYQMVLCDFVKVCI